MFASWDSFVTTGAVGANQNQQKQAVAKRLNNQLRI
jgi:1-aminocyclopropane-1-carboxylate deaminase/D-cysteine desulfhydrase-like pyridoxal-dependent ACC family enzyme|tara:strand:+ start:102 stop:209 length:108 start_codon:yes stop_codon:yes gene_type:complete